ncbi:MAG: hypothetical protein OXE46_02360 [Chloroflexi bacterium]|nr:hypothetical protein [Chloroflexota bacterium]
MKYAAQFLLLFLCLPTLAQAIPTPTAAATPSTALPTRLPFLQGDLTLLIGNVQRPNGLVYHEGDLFTVCNGDWTVYKVDAQTGDSISFVFGVRNGNSLIAESTETGFDLFVPDPESGALWQLDQRRLAPVKIAERLTGAWGITRLDDNVLLVSDTRANSIFAIESGGAISKLVEGLRAPTGIVRHEDRVYIANGGSARRGIEVFELESGELNPLVSGVQNTSNLALGADGFLYFAYALGTRGVVGRVDPLLCLDGGCSGDDIEPVVFSDVAAPLAITLSDDLRLFLHSRFRPEIYWVQLPA